MSGQDNDNTLIISGKPYQFSGKFKSPEEKEMIAEEARDIDRRLQELKWRYPEKTESELGILIALNKGFYASKLEKRNAALGKEIERLRQELESYLEKIG